MRYGLDSPLIGLLLVCMAACPSVASDPVNIPGAQRFLKSYPDADANQDGVLTSEENRAYAAPIAIEALGGNYTYHQVMVPMRDSVSLATGVFVPSTASANDSKHSTVLCRTAYGIWAAALFDAKKFANQNLVFVCQDLRGDGQSEGKNTANLYSFDNEINDGYDTIDWITQQSWSNGKVGMTGQSGHGFAAYMAYLAKHPGLVACDTNISGGNAHLYWTFHNGVKREMYYRWLAQRNVPISLWPKPGVEEFDREAYQQTIDQAADGNHTAFIARTGWYDIFSQSAIDYFQNFAQHGNVFVRIDPSGHGQMAGKPFPHRIVADEWTLPSLVRALDDPRTVKAKQSFLVYYLMGDTADSTAPGNEYRITHSWPVPNTATPYYMTADGRLDTSKPTTRHASRSFQYDPRDPVPSAGGDVFIHHGVGPLDQRVLKDRKDVLRFISATLSEPLEVTGKILADLYVSSDVPDTTFTAKLIDIYPDGYEAIIRDSIIMGRFNEGFDRQVPMQTDHIYHLKMDMWSTAIVLNRGHRIGVHISSSNSPKYEVHPNTFKPVDSFDLSPVATNTIHLSAQYPSHIVLPVVKRP
ncbi:CocE/NonD family hydrolase [Rubripirellula amarantea]|uniref:Cocaine esterase n=1 Tax=Rubripirellula amarantea TaxID=2527999 RepID=A0A5C5WWW6_9BACT|nr:CocE/NonD family hydrolase [Rubripirellula amarantea]MDA8745809.1 CocE/NonD family hydrolase [Rubripirellula amarantea]TWT55207.1 Cocaine esterase [Rubripirellula amarantea]